MLVVNVAWRGRTYVGTLLDSSQHSFAPPPPTKSTTAIRRRRRQGVKRKHVFAPSSKGAALPHDPNAQRQPRDSLSAESVRCPFPGCLKRFANVTAMKFHHNQAHVRSFASDKALFKVPATELFNATDRQYSNKQSESMPTGERKSVSSVLGKTVRSQHSPPSTFVNQPFGDAVDDVCAAPVLERENYKEIPSDPVVTPVTPTTNMNLSLEFLSQPPPLISACVPQRQDDKDVCRHWNSAHEFSSTSNRILKDILDSGARNKSRACVVTSLSNSASTTHSISTACLNGAGFRYSSTAHPSHPLLSLPPNCHTSDSINKSLRAESVIWQNSNSFPESESSTSVIDESSIKSYSKQSQQLNGHSNGLLQNTSQSSSIRSPNKTVPLKSLHKTCQSLNVPPKDMRATASDFKPQSHIHPFPHFKSDVFNPFAGKW